LKESFFNGDNCGFKFLVFAMSIQPQILEPGIFNCNKFLFFINVHIVGSVGFMKILGSKISNEDDMKKFLKVGFSDNMGQ
jgi:hypothetical protein